MLWRNISYRAGFRSGSKLKATMKNAEIRELNSEVKRLRRNLAQEKIRNKNFKKTIVKKEKWLKKAEAAAGILLCKIRSTEFYAKTTINQKLQEHASFMASLGNTMTTLEVDWDHLQNLIEKAVKA